MDALIQGVVSGNRAMLARTLTLIESSLPADQERVLDLIDRLLPHTGNAVRLGITGVPGAGKSTFIDRFGSLLTEQGQTVAVLAIDPSSTRGGGSILGDKTRMPRLAADRHAYIRPSPTGGTLGGVARKTRESMIACEAAGFDVVLVETVGVGQSETAVASMVDFFLVLMIAGAGDELQGMKKGILEIADAIVITKADGDNIDRAERARTQYESALHLLDGGNLPWTPPVCTCSAIDGTGLDEIHDLVHTHRRLAADDGRLEARRCQQAIDWMHAEIRERLLDRFYQDPHIRECLPGLIEAIQRRELSPPAAAARLLAGRDHGIHGDSKTGPEDRPPGCPG